MRSAPMTLDSRCARISVVRPCARRSSACWIMASFSASTEDSASSRIRIGESRSSARAIARSLPLAARQVDAALADNGLVALRQCRMNSCALASRAAGSSSSRVASGLPRRRFSSTVPWNRYVSCCTIAIWPRSTSGSSCADRRRRSGPRRNADRRGAAAAARASICPSRSADDADLLAGRDRETQPVERRPPPAGIGETHVLEFDRWIARRTPSARRPRLAAAGGGRWRPAGTRSAAAARGCRRRPTARPCPRAARCGNRAAAGRLRCRPSARSAAPAGHRAVDDPPDAERQRRRRADGNAASMMPRVISWSRAPTSSSPTARAPCSARRP